MAQAYSQRADWSTAKRVLHCARRFVRACPSANELIGSNLVKLQRAQVSTQLHLRDNLLRAADDVATPMNGLKVSSSICSILGCIIAAHTDDQEYQTYLNEAEIDVVSDSQLTL